MRINSGNVVNFEDVVGPDAEALEVSKLWRDLNTYRMKWIEEKKELRNFLYATDTRTTSNRVLPWSNSTTTPKLTQIRDNLHANYMATLFPNSNWLDWKADDKKANSKIKKQTVKGFMKTKLRQSGFTKEASKLVSDYIEYGNCFGVVEHVNEFTELEDGELIRNYRGPKLFRVSPYDIVFDPTAASFEESPKIIKKITTLGDIKKTIEDNPQEAEYLQGIFDNMISARNIVRTTDSEIHKAEAFVADGFSNIMQYYGTDYVELLIFYGNIYNVDTGEYKRNRVITIADRAYILEDKPQPSWLGYAPIFHAGWRDRPDNLYAMGPLDNLVGLQYRIDHLENLKADVFDQIAFPIKKIRGDVEEFVHAPGENIYVGDEGDVEYLQPDGTALNADFQIDRLIVLMEEMAGAPKEAMGFRTPGEKTAFEVSMLENSANRIFRHKTAHMEEVFFEPVLNTMLETARRNMIEADVAEVTDEATGLSFFETVTKEDIVGNGKIIPIGARHIAERNTRVQNLQAVLTLKVNDPTVGVHISGKRLAELIAEELNEPSIYGENIAVEEQLETAKLMEEAQVDFEEQQMMAAEEGL